MSGFDHTALMFDAIALLVAKQVGFFAWSGGTLPRLAWHSTGYWTFGGCFGLFQARPETQ